MKQVVNKIILIGLSHKTAPIEVREHFYHKEDVLATLRTRIVNAGIPEIVVLATCNRFEIYGVVDDTHEATNRILNIVSNVYSVDQSIAAAYFYRKYGRQTVEHLLAVAGSIESMVIGENEILGQVKKAYAASVQNKQTGMLLNKLFHQAFRTAKRIKSETSISKIPTSVASIATELLKQKFHDCSNCTVLMLGAGEMGKLLLKYLTGQGVNNIFIANRSLENAGSMAAGINSKARVISLSEVNTKLAYADIVVTSLAGTGYLVTASLIRKMLVQRSGKPVVLLDVAVPRNIDPDVKHIEGAYLYNIDDLQDIAKENMMNRYNEMDDARDIVHQDTGLFLKFFDELRLVPLIANMQQKCDEIRQHEVRKYRRRKLKHLSPDDFSIIEELTTSIMNKMLHNPIQYVKQFPAETETRVSKVAEKKIIEDMWINEQSE